MHQTLNPVLIQMLTKAHDVKLVIDSVTVALTVGSQSLAKPPPEIEVAEPNQFRLEKGIWFIRYKARTVERKQSIGLAHTHELLLQPNASIAATALCSQQKGEMVESKSKKEFVDEGYEDLGLSVQSDRGEHVVTEEAYRKILDGLQDMKEDLASLRASGENALAFEKQQEIEQFQEHLSTISFRGRRKRFSDPAEKARKRVSVAIARAIADLEQEHPALARHLDNSIHTGRYCRYAPEEEVQWIL